MGAASPGELLEKLCELIPEFRKRWEFVRFLETWRRNEKHHEATYDGLMTEFLSVFLCQRGTLSAGQLRAIGAWINEVVAIPSELEEAVVQCFLVEMDRRGFRAMLSPYLTRTAIERAGPPRRKLLLRPSRGPFSARKKKVHK